MRNLEKIPAWNKTEANQVLWEFSESESWSVHEDEVTCKPVAYKKTRQGQSLFDCEKDLPSRTKG